MAPRTLHPRAEVTISLLITQAAQTESPRFLGIPFILIQLIGFAVVIYLLILRPSGQARKRHAEVLSGLKKGDEVMTSGGIIGRVKDIKEVDNAGAKEVRVTVESGTATVVVERSRIVRVGNSAASGAPPA
jgi:preprotein translocase subunit YajC